METPVPDPKNLKVHKGPDLRNLEGKEFKKEADKLVREQAEQQTKTGQQEIRVHEEKGALGKPGKKGDYSYAGPKSKLSPKATK